SVSQLEDIWAVDFQRFIRTEFGILELRHWAWFQLRPRDGDLQPETDLRVGRIVHVDRGEIDARGHDLTGRLAANEFGRVLEDRPLGKLRLIVGTDPFGRKRCGIQGHFVDQSIERPIPLGLVADADTALDRVVLRERFARNGAGCGRLNVQNAVEIDANDASVVGRHDMGLDAARDCGDAFDSNADRRRTGAQFYPYVIIYVYAEAVLS